MSDRGYSKERTRRRSPSPRRYSRSRSRSPSHHRRRKSPPSSSGRRPANDVHRENPIPSSILGVFGLSPRTDEKDLREIFQKFGRVKDVQIVIDKKTNKSRGFGFVYFEDVESATRAKEAMNATDVDGHRLRIDYSVTKRAHTPTPGVYMGVRTTSSYHRSNGHSHRRSPSPGRRRHHHHHRRHDNSSRSRSRSRTRSRSRSRTRSRTRSRSRSRRRDRRR